MLDATKAYDFTIRFGEETDTLDGQRARSWRRARPVRRWSSSKPCFSDKGEIEQVPPAYSALKVA